MSFFALTQTSDILQHTTVSTNTTLDNSYYIIGCNASSGTITLTLPASSSTPNGKIYYIKDENGNLGEYVINIKAPSGTNLDGVNGDTITLGTSYSGMALYNDTSFGWLIIYYYTPSGGG